MGKKQAIKLSAWLHKIPSWASLIGAWRLGIGKRLLRKGWWGPSRDRTRTPPRLVWGDIGSRGGWGTRWERCICFDSRPRTPRSAPSARPPAAPPRRRTHFSSPNSNTSSRFASTPPSALPCFVSSKPLKFIFVKSVVGFARKWGKRILNVRFWRWRWRWGVTSEGIYEEI